MLLSMSDTIKHLLNGFLGFITTFYTALHMAVIIPPAQQQQLINAVVSILAGLLTGLMSKVLHRWFILDNNQKVIKTQSQTICNLQNQIQTIKEQSPSKDQPPTKQEPKQ